MKYRCTQCEFESDSPSDIENHFCSEHYWVLIEKVFRCKVCGYEHESPEDLEWHICYQHTEKVVKR